LTSKYGDIYAWISIILLQETAVTPTDFECRSVEL